MCIENIIKEATMTLINAPLIISSVDCIICRYFGETTCTFMIELSVGLAKHDIAERGMLTTRMNNV